MLKKASKLFHGLTGSGGFNSEEQDTDPGVPRVYTEPYFYGRITRQESEDILSINGMDDGLYLLRESITPMGNFSLSMAYQGNFVHYAIEKQVDGQYVIGDGKPLKDPVALINHYKAIKDGFITVPKRPCVRLPSQEAIAFRGLSYRELHANMKSAAQNMNANLARALGPMWESLLMHVLKSMHKTMPWFHGEISRDEGIRRLKKVEQKDGLFLIRSRADGQSFALTMSSEGQLRHYYIPVNDGETYSIENGQRFKALIILVDHYHNKRDGLPGKLACPVPNPDTKLQQWEEYKLLSLKLTQKPEDQATSSLARTLPPISEARTPPERPPPRRIGSGDEERDNDNSSWTSPAQSGVAAGQTNRNSMDSIKRSFSRDDPRQYEDAFTEEEDQTHPFNTMQSISPEEAEERENVYIDIRDDVVSSELLPENVLMEEILGSGQFGEVRKGKCFIGGRTIPVAVKTLKSNQPDAEKEILEEAYLMKQLNHQHIVRIIDFCKGECLMLVMELAELGPLQRFLRRHKDMEVGHLMELILQICDGMAYLESKDIVHRDLATRNVLLASEHFVKISDFGLSRMLDTSSDYYKAHGPGRWPLMWYAPECLYYHKFDSKSDVWSFGITMWEVMSFGARPYPKKLPDQILPYLETGNRLSKPKNADDDIYNLMLSCWEWQKENRPRFGELRRKIERQIQTKE